MAEIFISLLLLKRKAAWGFFGCLEKQQGGCPRSSAVPLSERLEIQLNDINV